MSSDCACPRFTPRVRATRVCVSVSWCAVHFVTRLTPGSELCLSQIAVNSGRQEMCLSAMFPRSLCLSSKPRPIVPVRGSHCDALAARPFRRVDHRDECVMG